MKKIISAAVIAVTMLLSGTVCNAQAYEGIDTSEMFESMEIDDDKVYSAVPEEAEKILEENGVTLEDPGEFTEITFGEVIKYIFGKFTDRLKYPMKTLWLITAAAVLSAAVSTFSETSGGNIKRVYETVSVMVTSAAIAVPASECLDTAASAIRAGGAFMLTYVPIYAGIAASSGSVTSAAMYNMTVIGAAEGAVALSSGVMLPLMSSCMAIGIADGINSKFSLGSLTALINKICSFVLVTVMTVFTGMLSMQSTVGTAADSIGAKTAKLAVSNFVPVVGGALSDTYGAVKAGLGLLKSAAGIYGIAAAALTLLPPVIEAASLYLALNIGASISDILGQGQMVKLLKNTASVIGMIMGILLCFGAMLIISTGILMVQKAE